MPTILTAFGFRLFFFSLEGNEPPHVHVKYQSGAAKFWISPVRLAANEGLSGKDVARAARIVRENEALIEEKWNEFFSRKT